MDEDQQKLSPDAGRAIVTRLCSVCHTVDGTAKIGPSFKGIWGEMHTFSNASPTLVDENYIRESILEPSRKSAKGFPTACPRSRGNSPISDHQHHRLRQDFRNRTFMADVVIDPTPSLRPPTAQPATATT